MNSEDIFLISARNQHARFSSLNFPGEVDRIPTVFSCDRLGNGATAMTRTGEGDLLTINTPHMQKPGTTVTDLERMKQLVLV